MTNTEYLLYSIFLTSDNTVKYENLYWESKTIMFSGKFTFTERTALHATTDRLKILFLLRFTNIAIEFGFPVVSVSFRSFRIIAS